MSNRIPNFQSIFINNIQSTFHPSIQSISITHIITNHSIKSYHISGFGFLEMMKREDSLAEIETLNGADLEGNKIRVERARRRGGYGKSPGVCK